MGRRDGVEGWGGGEGRRRGEEAWGGGVGRRSSACAFAARALQCCVDGSGDRPSVVESVREVEHWLLCKRRAVRSTANLFGRSVDACACYLIRNGVLDCLLSDCWAHRSRYLMEHPQRSRRCRKLSREG